MSPTPAYDSLIIVAFGGPEGPDDVMPFLENVTRGRNIPRERLEEVAAHYHHFGGKSPINDQVRALVDALRPALEERGISLPVYWGNRNWHPMLADTMRAMTEAGRKRTLAIVLAAYSSYSSCRQYRENIEAARQAAGPDAPVVDKLRVFYNHPDFIAANVDLVREALNRMPPPHPNPLPHGARGPDAESRMPLPHPNPLPHGARGPDAESRMPPPHPDPLPHGERGPDADEIHVAFTAHSIPFSMAAGCDYEKQLMETCRLVAEALDIPPDRWRLVYQSRSGRPQDPWLEPDILDHLATLRRAGVSKVVVSPIGFLSDHMEVLYDLDWEARAKADALGMTIVRAATVGALPRFVGMLADLVKERLLGLPARSAIGQFPANHDVCPDDCCPAPARAHPAGAAGAGPIRSTEPH